MKNIPKDQIIPYFLLLNSTLYIMISIITVLLAQVLLKWHWTFSPPFRNLIFRITRVELKSGLNKDITYFLLVHFHLNSSLKIFNYSFQTRRDHLLFFFPLWYKTFWQITQCMSETCLLYVAVLSRLKQEVTSTGTP